MSTAINIEAIKSLKTKDYLNKHMLNNFQDLSGILPMCYTKETESQFLRHEKRYEMPFPIEKVWAAYINIDPKDAWKGRRVDYSFTFDTEEQDISYAHESAPILKEGLLVFLEVKMAKGLISLAVTHQVNKINHEDKKLKLCYVEGGKSKGSQLISLEKTENGGTLVKHVTFYRSDSNFRDKWLYPFFHTRIINEFHQNIFQYLTKKQNPKPQTLSLRIL